MCWEVGLRAETGCNDGVNCFPHTVMLGAGCKDGVSCSRELDSRYDDLGVSGSLMCDAKKTLRGTALRI